MVGVDGVALPTLLLPRVVPREDENQLDLEAVRIDLYALLIADPFCDSQLA